MSARKTEVADQSLNSHIYFFHVRNEFVKIRLEYSSDHITYATTNDIFLLIF